MHRVVGILTDFGSRDHYVGVMKARVCEVLSKLNQKEVLPTFIDITNEIPPQDVKRACITLAFSYKYFPTGSKFLCVVDPGVGTERESIVVFTTDYSFVCPNNGILSLVLKEEKDFEVWRIREKVVMQPPYSTTFHGRDLFAPTIAYLLAEIPREKFLAPFDKEKLVMLDLEFAKVDSGKTRVDVWYVDRFGNLVTNFRKVKGIDKIRVLVNGKEIRLVNTYAEALPGELVAIFSSEELLEIAVNMGSAAKILGKNPEVTIEVS